MLCLDVKVVIYPLASSVSLTADRSIYPPGSRAALLCRVTGYPPVPLTWHKKLHRQPAVVLSPGLRAELDTFPESRTVLVSRLVLSNLTDTDTATYTCTADGISQVNWHGKYFHISNLVCRVRV